MAEPATSDWSTGSAGGSWTQPSGMWGAASPYGMQQQPYGSPYGAFGGGMPYGGGYPMQSPYGAPYGAPGGYGMPYGGFSPYAGLQGGYGMPQQMGAPQQMQAGGQAAPAEPLPTEGVTPPLGSEDDNKFDVTGKQTSTFVPWDPLGEAYSESIFPNARREYQRQVGTTLYDKDGKIISSTPGLGPLGFDPSSEAGLARMEQLAKERNLPADRAQATVSNITSGDARIGTDEMFFDLYGRPSISNAGQYSEMYNNPGITGMPQYQGMANRSAISNAGQYGQIYGGTQGAGSLAGGRFGEVARGDLMDSNPYREQAIEDAMRQTGDEVKATMSARGRYGSDAYGDAMGEALGRVATQARMAGYDTDTANMMAAAQARSGEALQRSGLGLQAATGLSGVQGQNRAAQLAALGQMNTAQQMNAQQRAAAAQGLSGVQEQNWQAQLGAAQALTGVQGQNLQNRLQAAGMAPAMQELRYDDSGRLLQAGSAREAMAQKQRDFTWDQLAQYRGMLGNLPGAAGSQTVEEDKPWWQTALGVAGTLGGIWGGLSGGGG